MSTYTLEEPSDLLAPPMLTLATRDRSYHYRFNAWAAVVYCGVFALIGFGAGHAKYGWICLGGMLLAIGFARSVVNMSRRTRFTSSVVLLTALLVGAQCVLPKGAAAASAYIPVCLVICSLARTGRSAFMASSAALALVIFVQASGILPDVPVYAPVPLLASASVCFAFFGTILQISIARGRYAAAVASQTKSREALQQEREQVEIREQELAKLTEEYRCENDRFAHQLRREAAQNIVLESRRAEAAELVKAIHHDLREPLRSIVSFSQLIQRKLAGVEDAKVVEEYLEFVEDGGQRMARMLSDLLAYTTADEDEPPVEVMLGEVLKEVTDNLADLIARKDATIQVATLPAVLGQRTQLLQLFQNLIANALKFSRLGVAPEIIVEQRLHEDGSLVIMVADNGIGIPEAQLDKVFGLFNRAHAHEAHEGSGVGLSLCKRIAIAHRATLSVESEVGVGTTFTLAFDAYGETKSVENVESSSAPKIMASAL